MIKIRKKEDCGHNKVNWLDSYHTFSFGDYYDPEFIGFGNLRVLNNDIVAPNKGFPFHSHDNMEIITIVLSGELEHKDSIGNGSVIKYGDVQKMSAGSGIKHSEFNPSKTKPVHLLQIWVLPNKFDIKPNYEQKSFSAKEKEGKLCLVASQNGKNGTINIHQDIEIYQSILSSKQKLNYSIKPERKIWLQVATGSIKLNGEILKEGDGVAIVKEQKIDLIGVDESSEILLFNLSE